MASRASGLTTSFSVYKPGQGYWTRVLTAIGAGTLAVAGAAWLANQFSVLASAYRIYVQAGTAVVLLGTTAAVLWWVLNKPRVVDFMIATEAEMKKVNWPTRREVLISTWIVICGTFLMAAILFLADLAFGTFFRETGVLVG